MSWNGFGVDLHSNFEMMLHLLHILALIFRSKFQLMDVFWKEIQLSTTISEIEKAKFQRYPCQKCVSNCCWK